MRVTFYQAMLFVGVSTGALASVEASAKTLTIALANNLNTFDPHMTASVGTDLSLLNHIYPSLITRTPDFKLQPSVAREWKRVDDLAWRFTLRDDAVFANGEKIDAEAVKWNMDRARDPAKKARVGIWFAPVSEITVISQTELEIRTKSPYPALDAQVSMFLLVPPKWAKDHNPAQDSASGGALCHRREGSGRPCDVEGKSLLVG